MSALSLFSRAEDLLSQGQHERAHRLLVQSLRFSIDSFLKADILSADAEALRALGRFKEALKRYREAQKLFQRLGVFSEDVSARLGASACLRILGSYDVALKMWSDFLSRHPFEKSSTVSVPLRAEVELERALVARGLGRFSTTRSHVRTALKFLKSLPKQDRAGKVQHAQWILGGVERFTGRFAPAARAFQTAAKLARGLRDTSAEAFALCGLAGVQRVLGLDRLSSHNYRRAHSLLTRLRDPFGQAYGLCGQANALRTFGSAAESINLYQRSARLYRRLGDQSSEGFAHWGMGGSFRRLKKFSRSWTSYQKALRLFLASKDDRGVVMAHLGVARWWEERGDVRKSVLSARRALATAQRARLAYETALARYEIGRILNPTRPPVRRLRRFGIFPTALSRWKDVP